MSDFWKHVFDNDSKQRRDIDVAASDLDRLEDDVRDLEGMKEKHADLERRDDRLRARYEKLKQHHLALLRRVNRLELVAEALFAHLESSGQLDRKGLRRLMKEIDADDGEVDGRGRERRT